MTYTETDNRLQALVHSRVYGTLIDWRMIRDNDVETRYVVIWRKQHPIGNDNGRTEFGVHYASIGKEGSNAEGLSDLSSGDYVFDFERAVKFYRDRIPTEDQRDISADPRYCVPDDGSGAI